MPESLVAVTSSPAVSSAPVRPPRVGRSEEGEEEFERSSVSRGRGASNSSS